MIDETDVEGLVRALCAKGFGVSGDVVARWSPEQRREAAAWIAGGADFLRHRPAFLAGGADEVRARAVRRCS